MNKRQADKVLIGTEVKFHHSTGVVKGIFPVSNDPRDKVPLFRVQFSDTESLILTYLILTVVSE